MAARVLRLCLNGRVWIIGQPDPAAWQRLRAAAATSGLTWDAWLDSDDGGRQLLLEGLRAGGHEVRLADVIDMEREMHVAHLVGELEKALVRSGEFEMLTDGRWRKKGEG